MNLGAIFVKIGQTGFSEVASKLSQVGAKLKEVDAAGSWSKFRDGAKSIGTELDKLEGATRKFTLSIAGMALGFGKLGSDASGTKAFELLAASVEILGSQIGVLFLPLLEDLTVGIYNVAAWIRGLDDDTKTQIATWLEWAAIGGVVVTGILALASAAAFLVAALSPVLLTVVGVTAAIAALAYGIYKLMEWISQSGNTWLKWLGITDLAIAGMQEIKGLGEDISTVAMDTFKINTPSAKSKTADQMGGIPTTNKVEMSSISDVWRKTQTSEQTDPKTLLWEQMKQGQKLTNEHLKDIKEGMKGLQAPVGYRN